MVDSVIVEADGGSRGNPGPAAYGAVLKDAVTGAVIAEDGSAIGIATNNVAEYSGLIAGLELAAAYAPGATVSVRMDSKLVVEQMSGRWQIKHPDMKPLAAMARSLAPGGTTYTWMPREQNTYADRLANEALDGVRSGVTVAAVDADDSLIAEVESPSAAPSSRGWARPGGPPTTLILVRHGITAHTKEKRFSGGLASANPPLVDEGREQVRLTAEWLKPLAEKVSVVIGSPVERTWQSAEIVASVLGKDLVAEPGFAEMEFGVWDGLTFTEVAEKFPGQLDTWLGSFTWAPEGGESFEGVRERVLEGLERVLTEHGGETVVVVSHVTPIKTLVARALGRGLSSLFHMELAPASVSVLSFYEDGDTEPRGSMRLFNGLPPERDPFSPTAW
ncbi:bifunctional RNase H/acid phosphatase [Nocardioides baekrokdamisoli]|uniref:Bifunctional RNase H/acid phosphatase n=1 Tax=Nocardioides baekrokdamisoli TaxID=1804624 RepID=A0A3G9IH86_9ACTN|nr:bifunctional RNase H/acid phosphatase [Nocardioides baekrokdamisoli]BBH18387.1 bifunctional RNase H/acid phosphatase [Nocardioides baekrokdamisoli]